MAAGLKLIFLSALMQGVNGQDWNVTVPLRIMGVEGSCVVVPCSFTLPVSYTAALNNCSGGAVWRKGGISGTHVNTVNVLGDLRQKNCTTLFSRFTKNQNNFYFFRLECPNSNLKYTFTQGVQITVASDVSKPSLTSVSHMTMGDHVTLRCSALAPCPSLPPSFTWTAPEGNKKESSQVLKSSDGQMMLESTLTFTASAQHLNQTVTCSVSYPLSAGGSTEAFTTSHGLNVLYGPMNTAAHMNASGPVSEGSVVFFSCSSEANPPVSAYTWFSNTNGNMVKVGEGPILPLLVKQAHSGLYECQAQSVRGTQRSKPLLLEVIALNGKTGAFTSIGLWVSIVCGVLTALCIFSVALLFYKYRSLSKRLKQVEQKDENVYSDLQNSTMSSDYDNLQVHQSKVKTPRK
ncbi:hypothetical protein NL108_013542 [Boleophthalmus pectinirostris]|uniref:myelin-associated glycoprotein n=1 Tax=Boleophthalmus pectinirostris TaxID=150288 RepID=UPI00242E2521|nr:myelin-associated glycoprotein [Boleophthalmus pectinirostris]XP_055013495.1 myelin-associated glycoprotein [Boleophthalmus pectinirostris]KAJ0055230.1 hypothetical protein NL108_013542 [Boleophthalmus pectinirostris]